MTLGRNWKTEIHSRGGEDNEVSAISYKTYSLREVQRLLKQHRAREVSEGLPKRKIAPITTWVLEELLFQFFRDDGKRGAIPEKIVVEDSKPNGF